MEIEIHPWILKHYPHAGDFATKTFPKRVSSHEVNEMEFNFVDNKYIVYFTGGSIAYSEVVIPGAILPIIVLPMLALDINHEESEVLEQTPLELLDEIYHQLSLGNSVPNSRLRDGNTLGSTWYDIHAMRNDVTFIKEHLSSLSRHKEYDLAKFDGWIINTRGLTFTKLKVKEIYRRILTSPDQVEYALYMEMNKINFYCHVVFLGAYESQGNPIQIGFSLDAPTPVLSHNRQPCSYFFPAGDAFDLARLSSTPEDFCSKLFTNINIHFYRLKKFVKVKKEVPDELSPNF